MKNSVRRCLAAAAVGAALAASAVWAQTGYPSRAADLDVLPGFRTPPPGYGEVAFYWWLGDPLTKDRLTWHLDQLTGKGVTALQVNYAHSDKGGRFWGLTYPSDPPLFSAPWWDLFSWFLGQARARGMAASLSDYTLGWAGNGWYIDEIAREHPEVQGATLDRETHDCSGCTWKPAHPPLSVAAYRLRDGAIVSGSMLPLRPDADGTVRNARAEGQWRIVSVYSKNVPLSLDPMHPLSGSQLIEKFFQRFENHNPGQSGKGLNYFFSDELNFGVKGWLWNRYFADEFRKRKGYDVVPELASLFDETGLRAVKIRLDYSDVMVALEEENYFKPIYDWHHSRGMLYGCDHGGRGQDVTEFGDYFRTQRWMTGPGNDQPGLASNVVKNKVASSITHLYERARTWLEGYYGSGWGTTSADVVDATWRNFAQGQNLLTLHGMYYSTHGGWWEWAPPCNHFHMPYWAHMGEFLHTVERLSYLLSQGHHRADVAIVYPVAAMESGRGGKESVNAAFGLGQYLYGKAIDFDFIDFESLARAQVRDRKLQVAGEEYRALVLPAMRVVRDSTLRKAVEFHRAGGKVVILGAAPEATERIGDGDPEVAAMVAELNGARAASNEQAERAIDGATPRDFVCASAAQPSILHRKAGARDIYFVYGAAKNSECRFRATGAVELWDPWTGAASELPVAAQSSGITTIRMPLEATEAQVIVFRPGSARIAAPAASPVTVAVTGDWEFELKPTLDNRYGDFRLPVTAQFIGPEARRLRYHDEAPGSAAWSDPTLDDSQWIESTYTYGPRFWKLGPLPAAAEVTASLDPSKTPGWKPYEFSLRWGIEGDPGHQGYHGLKAEVPNDFIGLGKLETKQTTTAYTAEPAGSRYFLWTSVAAPRAMRARIAASGDLPAAVWINGSPLPAGATTADLRAGGNTVLLRYDKPGRGAYAFEDPASPAEWKQTYPLASDWYNRPGLLPFDTRPNEARPAGWYRTTSPPGLRGLTVTVRGTAALWVDGRPTPLGAPERQSDGSNRYRVAVPLSSAPRKIAIRLDQDRGSYAGAAFAEPLEFDCGPGRIAPSDWSAIDGLSSYSGAAWYRKDLSLTAAQASQHVLLDLGKVSSSAEIRVNGRTAGVKLAPPFRVDISRLVNPGQNRIEVLVYSALSNHYQTIPTRYRRDGPSGLVGPVNLVFQNAVPE